MQYVIRDEAGVVIGLGMAYRVDGTPLFDPDPLPEDHPDVLDFHERQANPMPTTATRTAALIALYRSHGITEADIEAKIEDPEVIPDAGARYEAGLRFRSPTWERASVLLMQLAAAFDLTDEDVDALFRLAREIGEGDA